MQCNATVMYVQLNLNNMFIIKAKKLKFDYVHSLRSCIFIGLTQKFYTSMEV